MISISFEAHVPTNFGQSVRVVGNLPSLGDWAPAVGLDLITSESTYPTWRSAIDISAPDGIDIEFKLVIMKNSFEVDHWEDLPANRLYVTTLVKEKVLLRMRKNDLNVDDIYTGSVANTSLLILDNYTKLLSKYKLQPYPIIKSDEEYQAQKLMAPIGVASLPSAAAAADNSQVHSSDSVDFPVVEQTLQPEVVKEMASSDTEGAGQKEAHEQPQNSDEVKPYDDENDEGHIESLQSESKYDLSGKIGFFYSDKLKEKTSILTSSSHQKQMRLKNELKQLQKCLPIFSTNSIFVLYDEVRLDIMRALIIGSEDTPYSHGAFVFDIFIPDEYPQVPPLVAIVSTKGEKIRFNPNLYNDGLVCLSLLGTWEGNSSESWDPTSSNIYQVLVSIQSLVMNQDVYFNEPYYEDSYGTENGDQCNRAYSNIVKYFNISHTICDMIERPPPEFKSVLDMHFYLKRDAIKATAQKWIDEAKENLPCQYDELISDHNQEISELFRSSETKYLEDLTAEVQRMNDLLDQLEKRIPS